MPRTRKLFGLIGVALILIILSTVNVMALTNERESKDLGRMHILSGDPNGSKVSAFSDKWAVTQGDTFTVQFSVYGVDDWYGASLDLKFDKNRFEVVSGDDIKPGDIFDNLLEFDDAGLDEIPDYKIMISPVADDHNGDGNQTIGDVNHAGVINFAVLLLGDVDGLELNDGNWHSFAEITFKVKGGIDFTNDDEYLPFEFLFVDTLPDNFTDAANNGTAVVKMAASNDVELESGILTNKIVYQGFDVGGLILPTLQNDQYRAILEWDWEWDWDLREIDAHMRVSIDDQKTDISWDNEGVLTESPYTKWIGDFYYNQGNYCIPAEVITFNQTSNGIYDFFVEDFDEERFNGVSPRVSFYDMDGIYDKDGIKATYDFAIADNRGKGSTWDVFSFSGGQITPKNAVVVERYVNILLPGEPDESTEIIESDQLSATFEITLVTDNFELTGIDPEQDINVRMRDRYHEYQGEYVQESSGDGSFRFSFSGVQAGEYWVTAEVKDIFAERNGFVVKSYGNKPVAYQINPWVAPTVQYQYLGIHGYGLESLESLASLETDTIVKLVSGQQVVATTEGNENWFGVDVWDDESDYWHMDVELKAVGDFIPVGEYDVVIENANWDEEVISQRNDKLVVTDQPALRGDVYPWLLGADESDYSLRFEGINLNSLTAEDIIVELLDSDEVGGTVITIATSIVIDVEDFTRGWIRADFTDAKLNGYRWVYPVIKYSAAGNGIVLGGDRIEVEVVDNPVVYGLENDRVIPGETSYNLLIKGWNLDVSKEYLIEMHGDEGFKFNITTSPQNSTEMPFNLNLNLGTGLKNGWYEIEVYEINDAIKRHIGSAWLNAEPEWIEVTPHSVPVGFSSTTIILKEDVEFGCDIWSAADKDFLKVRMINDDTLAEKDFDIDVATDSQVTVNLPAGALSQGYYTLELLKNNIAIAKSWFDVYVEPSLIIGVPDSLIEGNDGSGVNFDATITTQNINLVEFNPDQDADVWMYGEFNNYKGAYDTAQSDLSSGALVFNFIGVEAGDYDLMVRIRDGFDEKTVKVNSYENKPVVYRVQPRVNPVENKYFGFDLHGYNLAGLSINSVVELLYKDGPNAGEVAATTQGDEDWLGIVFHPQQIDCPLRVNMKAIGNTMLSGLYKLRITDTASGFDSEIGLRVDPVEFTEEAVLTGVDPNPIGAGIGNYSINIHGMNLDQLNSANLLVQMEGKDKDQYGIAFWSVTTTQTEVLERNGAFGFIRATFSSNNPIPQDEMDLRLTVKENGIPIREAEEIWVRTTTEPVIYGVTPTLLSPGKTSYSFTLHGWNLEDFVLDAANSQVEVIRYDGNKMTLNSYSLSNVGENKVLSVTFNQGLDAGGYDLCINDTTYGYPGRYICRVSFEVAPGDISVIQPSTGRLEEGYTSTTITIKDDTATSYLWDENDVIDVRFIEPNVGGPLNVNADITIISVDSDSIEFVLGSGLSKGIYFIEVLRNGLLIGEGAKIRVIDVTSIDTTPPEIDMMAPGNNSVVNTVYPLISFRAVDYESGIDSVYFSLDGQERTGSLNQNNGIYSFIPEEALSIGGHNVFVRVENGEGLFKVENWMFVVQSPNSGGGGGEIEITEDSPLPGGKVGVSYSKVISVDGGVVPYTWSLSDGSILPNGLNLDSVTGEIYGTPIQQGIFNFGVRVTDSGEPANYNEKQFNISIEPGGSNELTIVTELLPNAVCGLGYNAHLIATGGTPPYKWTLAEENSLPIGLTLSEDGKISGTCNQEGNNEFVVIVTDDLGNSVQSTMSIKVYPVAPIAVSISINGSAEITIPEDADTAETYAAQILDQYGNIMTGETVTWSLVEPVEGVTIVTNADNSFTIIVTKNAVQRDVELKATLNSNGEIAAIRKISIKGDQPIDECFIATAAFGSKFTWPVALLRNFRDQHLLTNASGRSFVGFYYRNSPPIADFIRGSEGLKLLVKIVLLPIITIVFLLGHPVLGFTCILLIMTLVILRYRRQSESRVI